MSDPYDLRRFVDAQEQVFERVVSELREGRKAGHWMWFVFPQIAGLGQSAMARRYAIGSKGEAAAFLDHDTLGGSLRLCAQIVLDTEGRSIAEIFGHPDDLKFHSSMTLFAALAGTSSVFGGNLRKYFAGEPDRGTISILETSFA